MLTKGLNEGYPFRESERPFQYNFLKVNDLLTIGITASPKERKQDRKVAVRFMYNLSIGRMGVAMGNYL
ncbi:hypothetical protein [Dyadobacter psychrotolerans]|uniref:Uncharacterized protein n=1 Tax=Dyadobacter psychrotolerans TaxID=2541721 RepID=A0A4R5DRW5_9BACT|nr:hypothetical protein [Dyadobacter psychrotolerans]TDE17196.1 hypothetical protein E0F88_04670 [Dyadobacter psychrotolerans]